MVVIYVHQYILTSATNELGRFLRFVRNRLACTQVEQVNLHLQIPPYRASGLVTDHTPIL